MKGRRGCVDDPHRDVRLFCSCQSHQRPDFKPLSIMLVSRGCLPGRSWNSQVLVEAMTALQWSHRVRWRPRTLFLTRSLHVVDQSVSKTTQVHVFSSLGSKQNPRTWCPPKIYRLWCSCLSPTLLFSCSLKKALSIKKTIMLWLWLSLKIGVYPSKKPQNSLATPQK